MLLFSAFRSCTPSPFKYKCTVKNDLSLSSGVTYVPSKCGRKYSPPSYLKNRTRLLRLDTRYTSPRLAGPLPVTRGLSRTVSIPELSRNGRRRTRSRSATKGVSHSIRPQLRCSVDMTCWLLPILSIARSQAELEPFWDVDCSARWRRWAHSVGLRRLSIVAAKWSL